MEKAEKIDLKESFVWGLELPDDHPSITKKNLFLGTNYLDLYILERNKI